MCGAKQQKKNPLCTFISLTFLITVTQTAPHHSGVMQMHMLLVRAQSCLTLRWLICCLLVSIWQSERGWNSLSHMIRVNGARLTCGRPLGLLWLTRRESLCHHCTVFGNPFSLSHTLELFILCNHEKAGGEDTLSQGVFLQPCLIFDIFNYMTWPPTE